MSTSGYELLDAGDGGRLERFGRRVIDRPAPTATERQRDPDAWAAADARFEAGPDEGWVTDDAAAWTTTVEIGRRPLTFELRLASGGQVGLFPEHLAQATWLVDRIERAALGGDPVPGVLHLFAYTGALTLVAAAAGAAVAHVDASRTAVAWARRDAELSALPGAPVRWLVDDAARFAARELRRGRRYAGIVLDPPTYGHGPAGQPWSIADGLAALLATVRDLVRPTGFVLLTAHTPRLGPDALAAQLADRLPSGVVEEGPLELRARSGAVLPLGAFARWSGA